MVTRAMKHWVLCILLAFATQASSAAFDNHASHQAGTEHVSFEHHEHQSESAIDVESQPDEAGQSEAVTAGTSTDFDCHHCCHCHGAHHVYLPVVLTHSGLSAFKGLQPEFYANLHTGYQRNLLRPPIV